jgi:hypothetical protein
MAYNHLAELAKVQIEYRGFFITRFNSYTERRLVSKLNGDFFGFADDLQAGKDKIDNFHSAVSEQAAIIEGI